MEKTVEILIWSDNSELEQIANIIHDHGYHTAEIRKEELGKHENACNWSWCKANMIDSVCVDLFHHIGEIVPTENVEEMPLFRYVALFIVDEDDTSDELVMDMEDTASETSTVEEESKGEDTMGEKKTNVVMNIGCTTKDGEKLNMDTMMDIIGLFNDCTITPTIGYYKGKRENSLKIEIYDIAVDVAVDMARYYANSFNQECVALTVGSITKFITGNLYGDEFIDVVDELESEVK